jgi:hypothetical protein
LTPTSTSIQLFADFSKFLSGLAQKKCPYVGCRKESKGLKKEGASKIFLINREHEGED